MPEQLTPEELRARTAACLKDSKEVQDDLERMKKAAASVALANLAVLAALSELEETDKHA